MILALVLGGGFSQGCSVDRAREAAGELAAQEEKIKAVEARLDSILAQAQAKEGPLLEAFDRDKNGRLSRDEILADKPTLLKAIANGFTEGGLGGAAGTGGTLLALGLGLHSLDLRKKLAEYGTKGLLGWALRVFRIIGKTPGPGPKPG